MRFKGGRKVWEGCTLFSLGLDARLLLHFLDTATCASYKLLLEVAVVYMYMYLN